MNKQKKQIFGIQGGKGSFNEAALHYYTKNHNISDYETKYLYTTDNVFEALNSCKIDFGQFALHNAIGGLVKESLEAISRNTFNIIEEYGIEIRHCLMKRKDISFDEIDTFMSHPQVFKQCADTLQKKYSKYIQKVGDNELIDHAKVAEMLSRGEISENIAVIGPEILAEIYDLEIIETNLQDLENNITTFLLVVKI
jgi:prephenate dehydratase